jgi:hypothetical protein
MKKLILLPTLLSLTLSCTPLCGMVAKLTTTLKKAAQIIQHQTQELVYIPSVILTDSAILLGSNIANGYCKFKKNPLAYKKAIKNQLTIIKNDLEEDKRNIIRDLAKDYNITDEQLEKIIFRTEKYKTYATRWIKLAQLPAQFPKKHDYEFPLKEALPLLKKNNIDPDAIWLKYACDSRKFSGSAQSLSFNNYYNIDAKFNYYDIEKDISAPPVITIYASWEHMFLNGKTSTLIHEIGHEVEHHGLEKSLITTAIHTLTKAKYDDIYANENYKRLTQQHEREAEILPALKCKKDASVLRKDRRWGSYPKMLYSEHYFTLALIDTLHKLNDRLIE